jgi:prophage regulatory protein
MAALARAASLPSSAIGGIFSLAGRPIEGSVCMDKSEDRFLSISSVVAKTGRSRASIYRMVAAGSFPKQERIGMRSVAWRMSEIIDWMDAPSDYRRVD